MPFTTYTWTTGEAVTALKFNDLETRIATAIASGDNRAFNVKGPPYNATGNGSTDDATAIQAAINAAIAAGGGIVFFPAGTYIIGTTLVLDSNVYLVGAGKGATILKLKNTTNTALIKTASFDTLTGTNSTSGPSKFGLTNLTLDGNRANNATVNDVNGGIHIYGRDYTLDDFDIQNARGKGLYTEWYSGGDRMESRISRFKISDCSGTVGFHYVGPHDSVISNGQVIRSGATCGIQCGHPTISGGGYSLWDTVHVWGGVVGGSQATAWYVQAGGTEFSNCITEGATTHQLWIDAPDVTVIGGRHFGTGSADTSTCLRIGDTTTSAFPSRCIIKTELGLSQSLVNFNREGGNNDFELTLQTVATGTPMSGLPHPTSKFVGVWDNGSGNTSGSIRRWLMYPGHIISSQVGHGLRLTEGTNATMGAATLVAGTVTVNTNMVTANSRIFLTGQNSSGTHGELTVSARTAGTSFTITSSSGTDTRSVAWMIVEPTGF